MPKRTNAFQTVIFLLQSHLAGETRVTQSAELTDRATGRKREVDVCIEATIAGHKVLISLECLDHGRKATVEWAERMDSKHASMPTDRLVLVSRSGFTAGAIRKAQYLDIETITPEEFTDERAAELGLKLSEVRLSGIELVEVTGVLTTIDAT